MRIRCSIIIATTVLLTRGCISALAQQVTGVPGSPEVTTITGPVLLALSLEFLSYASEDMSCDMDR
jgi:hypothetical protein